MEQRSISKGGQVLLRLTLDRNNLLVDAARYPLYTVLVLKEGSGTFKADFGTFPVKAPVMIFATPLQTLQLKGAFRKISMLQFHGDYYCIEYHKKDVACNGILFNNIYTDPIISLEPDTLAFYSRMLEELDNELAMSIPAETVILTLIQLLLAKAATFKASTTQLNIAYRKRDEKMELFRELIDHHFLSLRKPSAYAKLLHLSPDSLTKRCKTYFRKTPSGLIQERIVLEAKKGLHLSRKSVKEIAHSLKFEDEHYFSRFFKKVTKVSPRAFRKKTGISIVADLSTPNTD